MTVGLTLKGSQFFRFEAHLRAAVFLLGFGLLLLLPACSDKSPSGPDISGQSSSAAEEGGLGNLPARPNPRVVPARPPIGPQSRLLGGGNWGSPQSSGLNNRLLTVTTAGATLKSECSWGVIEGPILVDAAGRFDALGTYQIQAGPTGPPQPARFVGLALGDTLMVTVIVTEDSQAYGPFTLTFGLAPQIGYCPIV